ncbi:hypothetical protein [Aquimarina sp. 2201CG14-23]|uniref:hypothetical protein n=1 Tax=Aquimarina mycalae TaxID=3040073 RepID=UPI0024781CEF|nr:hypothetical protein [Aquimarina sp. 2201CG14-23]MDH7444848.1 hypothetical protein [Aquimarina sp. 2201CG14-23]
MKNLLFIAFFSFLTMNAQQSEVSTTDTIEVGDVLTIGNPSGQDYEHISFPPVNFIIKKGGTPNFKRLKGMQVIVTKKTSINGEAKLTITRKDGKRFFNSHRSVKVALAPALETKEIL